MKHTIANILSSTTDRLTEYLRNPTNAQQEASWLLAHILACDITHLYAHPEQELSEQQHAALEVALHDRIEQHKPLAYILGNAPFGNHMIYNVRPPVLIPRPETEEIQAWLVEQIKEKAPGQPLTILDLCTGSGCIALSLAYELPRAKITGLDICKEAFAVAQENKERSEFTNIIFLQSNLFEAVKDQKFDIIISNPPYLSEEEWDGLSEDVKEWEAPHALKADNNGLAIYEQIIEQAHNYLSGKYKDLPSLVLEIGYTQKEAITTLLRDNHFTDIECHKDLSSKDRWISANIN